MWSKAAEQTIGRGCDTTMRIIVDLAEVTTREPAVLTVGFFDGVHRGHQAVVRRTVELAARDGARAILVTCWPHPLTVLQPAEPVPLLTSLDEKLALLRALGGLDAAVVLPCTPELAQRPADGLLAALRERYAVRAVVTGPVFGIGPSSTGDPAWLRRAGEAEGFAVETLDVHAGDAPISSTRIRELLAAGAVAEGAALLGRPYLLAGTVVAGDRRGRQLGFPTANLRLDPERLVPANGVYAVRVRLAGESRAARPAVANVGVRPTFGADHPRLVEVHLLDADLDLYDQPLAAAFVARLREERRFAGLEALKAQIAADADQARALLAAEPVADESANDRAGVRLGGEQ